MSSVPKDASIKDAKLSVYFLSGAGDLAKKCSLFTITKSWIENEITWNNATKSVKWEQLDPECKVFSSLLNDTVKHIGGGDHNLDAIATTAAIEKEGWEEYEFTDAFKSIIKDKGSFKGFLLKPYLENTSRFYASSNHGDQSKRPKLMIRYTSTGIVSNAGVLQSLGTISIQSSRSGVTVFVKNTRPYTATLTDIRGRTVCAWNETSGQNVQIPVSTLSLGVYVVQIKQGGEALSKSITLMQR